MAHNVEPMDTDNIESDFDNKENSIHHSNVYPRTPCTEKGYEELDVSELNMKLRYSITPASSPMSKSYTANCNDNRGLDSGDDNINPNLTRSLHSAISKADVSNKSVKTLPLQTIPTEQFVDSNRNAFVLRPLDTTGVIDNNVTITVSESQDPDENLSFPSSSSSTAQTPEATTPTKENIRSDGGSPIMRGLKSVLNMFRPSQSPIPLADNSDGTTKQVLSPAENATNTPDTSLQSVSQAVLASTPIAANKHKDRNLSKRNSPLKESIVFNEDLEKELLWKDETTILFSQEKIPIHKLFFQQGASHIKESTKAPEAEKADTDLNSTVEYMDISYNDSMIKNKTITEFQAEAMQINDSDTEFVDCETTFTNDKPDTYVTDLVDSLQNKNEAISNVTEVTSTSNPESLPISTETPIKIETLPVVENTPEKALQLADFPITPKEETNIADINSESKVKSIEHDESNNISCNIHDVIPETKEVLPDLTVDTKEKSIKTNALESHMPLDATFKTPNVTETFVKDLTLDAVKNNEPQMDATFNTCNITTDITPPNVDNTTHIHDSSKSSEMHEKELNNASQSTDVNASYINIDNSSLSLENHANMSEIGESTTNEPASGHIGALDLPADIPLPDEDDIEHEKSIGGVMLVEESNIPFSSDHNNSTTHELEIIDHVENVPIEPAKLIDVNSTIDDCNKDFVANDNENKTKLVETDVSRACDENISVQNNPVQDIQTVDIIAQNEPMHIDNSIYNNEVTDVVLQPSAVTIESNEKHLNLPPESVSNASQLDVNAEINEVKTEETGTNAKEMPHSTSEISLIQVKNLQEHEPRKEEVQSLTMGNDDTLANYQDAKEIQAPQSTIDESQSAQAVLNVIDNVFEVKETKPVDAEDTKSNKEVNAFEEILHKESPSEIMPPVAALPTSDVISIQQHSDPMNKVTNVVEHMDASETTTTAQEDMLSKQEVVKDGGNKDEEIVISESSSPYVSLAGQIDPPVEPGQPNLEEIESPFATKSKVVLTPPSSPKIVSKGYNFNFDDIDDPFATKTKIRLSPTPDMPEKVPNDGNNTFTEMPPQKEANKNRRKSQPERKKPLMPKKKMNSTFSGTVNVPKSGSKPEPKEQSPIVNKHTTEVTIDSKDHKTTSLHEDKPLDLEPPAMKIDTMDVSIAVEDKTLEVIDQKPTSHEIPKEEKSVDVRDIDTTIEHTDENKSSVESLTAASNETKNTSSSEQSTYYSAGTSSGEGAVSRNVFNLPEIDDMNFNPFVTKTKVRQSPPPSLNDTATLNFTQDIPGPSETKSKIKCDVTFTENPFETKSKMRQSPPPSLNETATINTTQDKSTSNVKSDATFTEDFEFNKDFVSKECNTLDERDFKNVSNITCSSQATDEKDLTVREVHTEDEDTIEGPFLEAEDINNDDKMSDFDDDDVDMMQFSELPTQGVGDNADAGELFIDAEAFEFLLNQNKSNVVADSGKESLFLKFDPLFAKRMSSDGVLAALNKKRQSTPKKMVAPVQMDATFDKSIAGPSTLNVTHEVTTNNLAEESTDDFNITVSKPMMVVTPAVNPIVTPRNRNVTPPSSNRRSITFTSPAIAVIDRLLSLSANNSLVGHDTTVTHMSREQTEADLALTQLRELLAEKEISVYNLRTESKELKDRLSTLESQMRNLETESHDRLQKINDLNEKLSEKTKLNKSMAAVVEEYERTIASLIAETEQDKKRNNEERIRLIKERDEQTAHLASMEVSFSDLHSKYEKSKQIILTCKANEDSYKKSIKEFEENLTKMQSNYELLKQHATSKLNHANQELEKMNRSHEAEVLKLNAMIKRKELHITSLEETLAQKTKANEELTAICDELINKVG